MKKFIEAALITTLLSFGYGGSASWAASSPGISWAPCTNPQLLGLECARFQVPKDYLHPNVGTFDLAVVRAPSNGTAGERMGTLFFNPGGPGVASLPMARGFVGGMPESVRRHFDIVLWDPRGVGASSGLNDCTGGSFRRPATGPVNWKAIDKLMRRSQTLANARCKARYPQVVPYISTQATVRDLEALRKAVGDPRLTYWGTSYGTRIGYVYAHNYPDQVRAMLLSSPVDPNATWASFAFGAALAPDTAIGFAFELFPGTQEKYLRSAKTLDNRTLILPSGTEFTRWIFRGMINLKSTNESAYPGMAEFINHVDTALHGEGEAKAVALKKLDEAVMPDLPPMNGGATVFIGCSDYGVKPNAKAQNSLSRRIRDEAPITGWVTSQVVYFCNGVRTHPDPVPVDFTNWHTPMLIIGSTRDSLTSYQWVSDMARTFRNSRVVTYVGSTHTPVLAGSSCVDQYAFDYLVDLKRPEVDMSCPNTLPSRQ